MSLRSKLIFTVKLLLLLISCDFNNPRLHYNSELDKAKEYQVILMAGQSNMVGLGKVKDIAYFTFPDNVIYFNHSTNTRLKKLLNHNFGPEVGIANVLNREFPDSNFILIKYAIGGSSIEEWLPEVESKIPREIDFGDLYHKFYNMADSITKPYKTKNVALLWMQGETDTRYFENANHYKANFKAFIERIREDFNVSNLPVLYGKVNPEADGHNYLQEVQKAQEDINNTIENTYLINTDDLNKFSDNVHYSSNGLLELGKRYGEILIAIINRTK